MDNDIWRYVIHKKPTIYSKSNPLPLLINGKVAITAQPSLLANKLLSSLKERNIDAFLIDQPIEKCDVLIYLKGLENFSTIDQAIASNAEAFQYVKSLAPHLKNAEASLIFFQRRGKIADWASGLSGLAKTLNLEFTHCHSRVVDLSVNEDPMLILNQILDELFNGGEDLEISLENRQRLHYEIYPSGFEATTQGYINAQSVIIVTGGARGITAQCLVELANSIQPTFILLGRTKREEEPIALQGKQTTQQIQHYWMEKFSQTGQAINPKKIKDQVQKTIAIREVNKTINQLRKKGCKVEYYDIDVNDTAALKMLIGKITQQYQRITGIIHGAGVISDKEIIKKDIQDFLRVFNTKVNSLQNLLSLTAEQPLTLIVLFSSIAARYGNIGQVDYAMANEILNHVAHSLHHHHQNNCLVKSINWAAWDSGMVTPELKEYFIQRGVRLLPTKIGVQLFAQEVLQSLAHQVEIILGPAQSISASNYREVNLQNYPLFKSHQINQHYVIPIAWIIIWMMDVINQKAKSYPIILGNFAVINGVKFDTKESISLQLKESETQILIEDQSHKLRYKAAKVAQKTLPIPLWQEEGSDWPWNIQQAYQEKLFHGVGLQVLQTLSQLADHSCNATIHLPPGMNLEDSALINWIILDGALQLGILWGWHKINQPTLPISIEKIVGYDAIKPQERVEICLKEVATHTTEICCDLVIRIAPNNIIMALYGVTFYPYKMRSSQEAKQ